MPKPFGFTALPPGVTSESTPKPLSRPAAYSVVEEHPASRKDSSDEAYQRFAEELKASAARELDQARTLRLRSPNSILSNSRYAQAALNTGHEDEALSAALRVFELTYRKASEDDSFDAGSVELHLFSAVRILIFLKREDNEVNDLLEQFPFLRSLAVLRAVRYIDSEYFESAIDVLMRLDSDDAGPSVLCAYSLYRLERETEAIQFCRQALRAEPRSVDALVIMSRCYSVIGNHAKAIRFAVSASKLAPLRQDVILTELEALMVAGSYHQVSNSVEALVRKRVSLATHVFMLAAGAETAQGKFPRAIYFLREAERVESQRESTNRSLVSQIQSNIVNLSLASGRISSEQALAGLRTAWNTSGSSPVAALILVRQFDQVDNADEAKKILRSVERNNNADHWALPELRTLVHYLSCEFRSCTPERRDLVQK